MAVGNEAGWAAARPLRACGASEELLPLSKNPGKPLMCSAHITTPLTFRNDHSGCSRTAHQRGDRNGAAKSTEQGLQPLSLE